MRYLLFILLCTATISAFPQTEINTNDYRLIIGPDLPSKSNFTVSEMIGHDESGFYVIRSKKRGFFGGIALYKNSGAINEKARFFIEKYDYQLKFIKSVDLDEVLDSKGFDYHFIEYQNNKIQLYISQYNAEQKSRSLFTQEVSKESLLPIGQPTKLQTNTDLRNSNFKGEYYASAISPDEKHNFILVESDIKNKNNRTFQFISFDQNYHQTWEHQITIPFPKKNVEIRSVRIDNYNQAHILIKIKSEHLQEVSQLKLYSILESGENLKEMTFNIPDKFISNIQTASLSKNEFVCAGFYSNNSNSSIDGTFYFKLDIASQQIIEKRFKEFDIDFITQYMKGKKAKRLARKENNGKEIEMPDYVLDDLVINSDGSIYLIAEQFRVDAITTYSQYGGATTTYYFNYDDIIVVKFNSEGDINWMTKIPKNQRSTGDEGFYSSYSMIMQDEDLYFIYNDNLDNYQLEDLEKVKNYSPMSTNSATMISHVAVSGKHTKKVLLYNQQIDARVKPTISHHLSHNEVILYGHRGIHQNFIAVDLKKR